MHAAAGFSTPLCHWAQHNREFSSITHSELPAASVLPGPMHCPHPLCPVSHALLGLLHATLLWGFLPFPDISLSLSFGTFICFLLICKHLLSSPYSPPMASNVSCVLTPSTFIHCHLDSSAMLQISWLTFPEQNSQRFLSPTQTPVSVNGTTLDQSAYTRNPKTTLFQLIYTEFHLQEPFKGPMLWHSR